jgi:hypothetical protein
MHGFNWMFVLNHFTTESNLLPTTFQVLRFEIKFIFSFEIRTIDAGEGLNSRHVSCTHNSSAFLLPFITYSYE